MENQTGRNSFDVVMELINLHFKEVIKKGDPITEADIERIYLKYYKLVKSNR